MVLGILVASSTMAFAATATNPFQQLGSGTLPSFLLNPINDIRAFFALVLLIIAAWKMGGAYFKGHHKMVYGALAPFMLIEWLIFSPDTLFTVANTIFTWVSTNWF